MKGKFWLAVVALFVVFSALDFVFHNLAMSGYYAATKELWRPEETMGKMMPFMWLVTLVSSFFFVYVFGKGYQAKGVGEGIRFGLFIGIWFGVSMGLGSYAVMPITGAIAVGWLLITIIECVAAGIVTASIYRPART